MNRKPEEQMDDDSELVSLDDVRAFLKRWFWVIVLMMATGALGGKIYARLNPRYVSEYLFESSRLEPLVLRDSKLINTELTTAFGQLELCQEFSAIFFKEVAALQATGVPPAGTADKIKQTFAAEFGGGGSDEEIQRAFARYLNLTQTDFLRKEQPLPAGGFYFLFANVDGTNYRLDLSLASREMIPTVIAATHKAANRIIALHNDQERQGREDSRRMIEAKAKETYDNATTAFFQSEPQMVRSRTENLAAFYQLENRLQKLEPASKGDKKRDETIPMLSVNLNTNGSSEPHSDSVSAIDLFEHRALTKRIAALKESGEAKEAVIDGLIVEFSKLQSERNQINSRYAAQSKAFHSAEDELSRSITEISLRLRSEEFTIPLMSDKYSLAFVNQTESDVDEGSRNALKFSVIGAFGFGALGSLTLAGVMSFVGSRRKSALGEESEG